MRSGYRIFWTDLRQLDHIIELISKNPELFPESTHKKGIRKAVVAKFNSLYYRINDNSVEILSFFSNRQDPDKIKV